MTCKVKNCRSAKQVGDLCRKHYLRVWRHGTTDLPEPKRLKGADNPHYQHGMSGTKTYRCWYNMIQRCQNPKSDSYRKYGAKGISVCDRWLSFENFYSDMGDQPAGETLDRIDSAVGYEPSNCRWATYKTQNRNRPGFVKLTQRKADKIRSIHKKRTVPRKALAEMFGVSEATIKKVVSGAYWKTE